MKSKTIVAIAVIILICSGVYINSLSHSPGDRSYPINMGSFVRTGQYKIDPDSILLLLNETDQDVFAPLQEDILTPVSTAPVKWKQSDYLKISTSLQKFVWNEKLDSWALYRMEFRATCQDELVGFDAGEFYYYKVSSTNGEKMYSVRGISIDPQYNSVSWGGDTYFPPPILSEWKSINLDKNEITAEEALQKADEMDGKAVRATVQNQCYIYVSMYPESRGYNWIISYGGNEKIHNVHMSVPSQ